MRLDHLESLCLLQHLLFHRRFGRVRWPVCLVGGRGSTRLVASPTAHLQTYFEGVREVGISVVLDQELIWHDSEINELSK